MFSIKFLKFIYFKFQFYSLSWIIFMFSPSLYDNWTLKSQNSCSRLIRLFKISSNRIPYLVLRYTIFLILLELSSLNLLDQDVWYVINKQLQVEIKLQVLNLLCRGCALLVPPDGNNTRSYKVISYPSTFITISFSSLMAQLHSYLSHLTSLSLFTHPTRSTKHCSC